VSSLYDQPFSHSELTGHDRNKDDVLAGGKAGETESGLVVSLIRILLSSFSDLHLPFSSLIRSPRFCLSVDYDSRLISICSNRSARCRSRRVGVGTFNTRIASTALAHAAYSTLYRFQPSQRGRFQHGSTEKYKKSARSRDRARSVRARLCKPAPSLLLFSTAMSATLPAGWSEQW
jgi:hypothetical protein